MQKPVRETFRIAFRMQEWAKLIEVISLTGSLSILAGPPVAWRILIQTMEPAAFLEMVYRQARGDVTFQMRAETVTELQRHYEAWAHRLTNQEEETKAVPPSPIAVLESFIGWNTETGMCQGCHRPNQQLSVLERYLPGDLYRLILEGLSGEEKYQTIFGITTLAVKQVRDQFPAPHTQHLCEHCLKRAFAGFTKKDAYEDTKRGIEQEGKQHTDAWSAIFYCLKVGGTTRQEMIDQSQSAHIAASGFDERPSLHDLLDIGNDAAKKQFPQ